MMPAAARSLGADSLVIGAHCRHRFVEWALGSVTRRVLNQADLPYFMLR